jgi:hypothetical protein
MLSGYESNLIKLMVECLDKHTTELKNLNTNLNTLNNNLVTFDTNLNTNLNTLNINLANLNTNLGVKLDDLSNKIHGLTGEFDTFNGGVYGMMVTSEQDQQGLRVWLSNVGAW